MMLQIETQKSLGHQLQAHLQTLVTFLKAYLKCLVQPRKCLLSQNCSCLVQPCLKRLNLYQRRLKLN